MSLLLCVSALVQAQAPSPADLREHDELQRRDLSIPGSRMVINPYHFKAPAEELSPSDYSNSPLLPLHVGYLTIENDRREAKGRFGREYKDVLQIRKKSENGTLEVAETYNTAWYPYSLPFSAEYKDGTQLTGYDFFVDENTLTRVLQPGKGAFVLSGTVQGKISVDDKNYTLIIQAPNVTYTIGIKGLANRNVSYYATEEDLQKQENITTAEKAVYWMIGLPAQKRIDITVRFSLPEEPVTPIAFSKSQIDKAYTARINFWNDFLQNKVPHPLNFDLTNVPNKGVTPEQLRLTYYKAWVFLAQNVLPPQDARYPYYQVATGKVSLWDEGHAIAPFSAAWESFVGLQLYAYIDPEVSWSSLKGLLSLVEADGMLGGESLPSRKAHSAWLLYELTGDKDSLEEVFPALERYLNWRMTQPRWIHRSSTPEDEKDAEFVVSAIVDMEYMAFIATALGKEKDAADWQTKRSRFIEQYKAWFWKTPQDLPVQYVNHWPNRNQFPIRITTGLYIPEMQGDYLDGLMGMFYKYYDTDKVFAGFKDPKYPDVDFTIYGLILRKKDVLARGLIETNLRDVVRTNVFSESYYGAETPYPSGVRPSLFGMAAIIDFTLLKNGYMYTKGTPSLVNIYGDAETGVKNIRYKGKRLDIYRVKGNEVEVSGEVFEKPQRIPVDPGEIKMIFGF